MDPDATFRPAGSPPASPFAPYSGPWNARLAAHLLRRAGFGGSPADVAHAAGLSTGAAVDALIRFPSTAALPAPPGLLDTQGMALQRPADMTAEQRMALARKAGARKSSPTSSGG